ncbi:MAG: glycosyltransferase family 4 protein [Nitrososphaeria archaeon]
MRVALFKHHISGFGGTERLIIEYMKRSRYETILFTDKIVKNDMQWIIRKYKVVEIGPSRKIKSLEKLHPLILKLPLESMDVFLPFIGEVLSEAIILRNNSIPTIGYVAGTFRFIDHLEQRLRFRENSFIRLPKIYGLISSHIFNKYNELVANSNFVQQKLYKWIKLKGNIKKIHVIHPGVDTTFFKPRGVYGDYFLVVSRIERLKRLELVINAFNLLKKLYDCKFRLVIAGYLAPQNKSYLNYLINISKKDIDFILNPSDDKLLKLYQECYAFVFSSFKEPFGITPLEAMSCGKPVIATGEGGFMDYLVHGQNGFITDSDPYAIARKMLLLAQNYELTVKMGEEARKKALFFDWKIFSERMDHLIEHVLHQPNRSEKSLRHL